mgnify:CR=1 FL=1
MTPFDEKFKCPRRAEVGADISFYKLPEFDEWTSDHKCSWCGSLHPDVFMTYLKQNKEITPTDKTYKVYLDDHRKFYFQHLSKEQMEDFVNLFNKKQLNIGYPGHFYVTPFFMSIIPKTKH